MYDADRESSTCIALGVLLATIVDRTPEVRQVLSLKNYLVELQRQPSWNALMGRVEVFPIWF
jgi:hypothetical protein